MPLTDEERKCEEKLDKSEQERIREQSKDKTNGVRLGNQTKRGWWAGSVTGQLGVFGSRQF